MRGHNGSGVGGRFIYITTADVTTHIQYTHPDTTKQAATTGRSATFDKQDKLSLSDDS